MSELLKEGRVKDHCNALCSSSLTLGIFQTFKIMNAEGGGGGRSEEIETSFRCQPGSMFQRADRAD